jgi:hypothetical protein
MVLCLRHIFPPLASAVLILSVILHDTHTHSILINRLAIRATSASVSYELQITNELINASRLAQSVSG